MSNRTCKREEREKTDDATVATINTTCNAWARVARRNGRPQTPRQQALFSNDCAPASPSSMGAASARPKVTWGKFRDPLAGVIIVISSGDGSTVDTGHSACAVRYPCMPGITWFDGTWADEREGN